MKQTFISKFLICVSFFVIGTLHVYADEYVVIWSNSSNVYLNNKQIKKGTIISEIDPIKFNWPSGKDAFEVKNKNTGERIRVFYKKFLESKARNLAEYKAMGARGGNKEYYLNNDYFLVDYLHFEAYSNNDSEFKAQAVWYDGEEEIVTNISYTSDRKFFVIDKKIFGKRKPRDIRLTIREVNPKLNWVNEVYKDINIIYIPKKSKKKDLE